MLAQDLCAALRENLSTRGPAHALFAVSHADTHTHRYTVSYLPLLDSFLFVFNDPSILYYCILFFSLIFFSTLLFIFYSFLFSFHYTPLPFSLSIFLSSLLFSS